MWASISWRRATNWPRNWKHYAMNWNHSKRCVLCSFPTLFQLNLSLFFLEKNGTGQEGRTSHEYDDLGGSGAHVSAVWHIGTSHLVGILLGYYGTSNLFCYLRHHNGHVRLLLCDKAGELSDRYTLYKHSQVIYSLSPLRSTSWRMSTIANTR